MELVILLGVLSIMISGILALFFNVITVNKSAEYYSRAYKIVDSKIEELRGLSFDSIETAEEDISTLPLGHMSTTVSNVIDGSPQADIKEVKVVASWNFRKQSEVKEVTYITKGGIKK